MKRNCLNIAVKYLIGASLALIAVSNCFNALSNSSLFVASPSSDVSRSEAAKPEPRNLGSSPSVSDKLNSGSSLFANSLLNPANGYSRNPFARLRPVSLATPFAAALTATKTDNISTPVNPGDTIMYTIEITNTGTVPLTNVNFTDTIDANTTLVAGSVKVSPIAVNDTYNTIGNVNIQVPVAQGVIANDFNPNGSGTLEVTFVNATAVPSGGNATAATTNGSVTMNSDGSFTYTPNAGFGGPTDTFTYTLGNGTGKTDTATVTINISGLIWFVNNAAGPAGDGRLSTPFRNLVGGANPLTGTVANDVIFIYTGAGNYTGGLTLTSGEKVIGQGATQSILTITGFTAPSGPNLLPATGGSNPVITTAGVTAITLGSNNGLHGFTVGDTGAAGTDISGTGFGTLTALKITVNGTGRALNLATGAIASGSTFDLIESSGGSNNEGVRLNGVGGSFTATTTNIVNPTGTGIDLQSCTVAAGGFNFGATIANKGSSSGTGVNLNANTGTISFSSLAVTTSSGTGVSATSSGTVNVTTGSISATGGPALLVNPTTLGMSFTTVTSTGSSGTGISLTSVSGSLTIGNTTVTNATGIGINVQGLTAGATAGFGTTSVTNPDADAVGSTGVRLIDNVGNVSFGAVTITPENNQRAFHATNGVANSGSITITSGTMTSTGAIALEVNRTSAGTIPLMMSLTNVSASNGTKGISLQNTSGSFTITGTGTTDGSGGTITDSGSTMTRGIELINAQNISLSNMTLTNACRVNGAVSDGVIASGNQNVDENGAIHLQSVTNVSLTNVDINGSAQHGINGNFVTNLDITDSVITNCGNAVWESSIYLFNLRGLASANQENVFSNVDITNTGGQFNIAVFNNDGTNDPPGEKDRLEIINGCDFSRSGMNDLISDNVTIFNSGTGTPAGQRGNFQVIVSNATFSSAVTCGSPAFAGTCVSDNIQVDASESAAFDFSISNSTFNNAGQAGINISGSGTGTGTFSVMNNSSISVRAAVGINVIANGSSDLSGTISGNTISTSVSNNPAFGISLGAETAGSSVIVDVNNNSVTGASPNQFSQGMRAYARSSGTLDLILNNNSVQTAKFEGIEIASGNNTPGEAPQVCVDFISNNIDGANGSLDYLLDMYSGSTFRIKGLTGSGTNQTNVENFVAATDDDPSPSDPTVLALGGTVVNYTSSAGCASPPIAPMAVVSDVQTQSAKKEDDASIETGQPLIIENGQARNDVSIPRLTMPQLAWIVQAAIERWRLVGVSAEDLARMQQVGFEIADLPYEQIAVTTPNGIRIDETASGYGWYYDEFPMEDGEFQVLVTEKELQATDLSLAYGRMDLLTVVMRELGQIYLQGKDRLPKSQRKNLRQLMGSSLSPSVRRLPLDQLPTNISPTGSVKPSAGDHLHAQASAPAQPDANQPSGQTPITSGASSAAKIPVDARYAVFNPGADNLLSSYGTNGGINRYASRARRVAGSTGAPFSGETVGPLNLGTIPPGEKAVIMFSVTVNNPVTANTTQVCNQGSVTSTEVPGPTLTNDPDTVAANDPTCTQLNVSDLAVTKTDSPDPVTAGNNITYTVTVTNNGPAVANSVTLNDAIPANTTFVSTTTPAGWTRNDSTAVGGTGTLMFSKPTMANAESAVFTIVVKVNSNTTSGTTITNTATAATTSPDPTANDTATATTTVNTSADLAVTKTGSPTPNVNAGDNITYTINFTNNGPSDAQTVTVTDAVPANTTFVSAVVTTGSGWSTSAPSVGGTGNVVFSKATVAAGETAVFTVVVNVNAATPNATVITNNAVAASATTDPTPANNTGTATTTVIALADVAVTKSDSPDPVFAGNNITYTINFVNNGPATAGNVTVTDAVPANCTFVSAVVTTGSGWSTSTPAVGGTGNVVFSKAAVPNAETAVFTIVVKVNSNTASGTTITNSVTAATTSSDPDGSNNTATATTTVNTQADLAVTKSDSPDPVSAGANLTYTINFVNNGPSDAQTVTVTDAVPANTTFVSAVVTTGSGWSTSAPAVGGTGNVVFSKATVTAGETAVFTIVVNVGASTASGTTITNSAVAATVTTDPTPANDTGTATTTVQTRADLAVTKSDSPDPVTAGNNLTYTINFSSAGPSDAQTVTVTDAVPANTTFVSAMVTSGSGWSISAPAVGGTGNVVFSKATVVSGETATFSMVVNVSSGTLDGTIITNSATAASATTDPTPGNNTGTATTTVSAMADLAVTKSDSPDPVFAGNNITYTINFANNGPSSAQSVTVTDATPANTTFVSAVVTTGSGWSISTPAVGGTGNVVFSKASVAAGETAVFTMVVNVNSNTGSGTITNNAVAASTTADPTPGNNTGTATTTVQAQADLAVTKSDSPDPVTAGNNLTYTINFVNNGPSDAATVTVTDAVPANTTFVSAVVTTGSGWSTSAPAVGGTGNIVFSKAMVVNGETAVFTVVVNVNANTANGATITNSAVAASATSDPSAGNSTGTTTTTVQTQADLAVTKSDSPDPVTAGNNLTYTINFTNNGPSDAQTVTVTDAVPANATFVSAVVTTGTGWSTSAPAVGGTGNVVFSKATVAAGETAVFTIVVNINSNTANGATITNSATAASSTTDPTPGNDTGTATTTVQTSADIAVTKTDSPDPVIAGSNLTYTINFVSNGPSDAQTVTVTDAVPANTTFVSAVVTTGSGWSISAPAVGGTGNVVFSKASVAAGETAVFTMVVKVNSNTASGATITNSAVGASATTDPTPGNNTGTATTTVQVNADLAVTKSDSPDPVVASQNLTYTINFSNNGPSDAQSVTVTDAVPANTTFVSAVVTTGSGWSISAPAVGGTGNVVFSKAAVVAGETAVFTIVVNVNANTPNSTIITNSATAASTTADSTPANNTGTATTTVIAQADLAVTKSDSPDPACSGQNLTYTIGYSNNGPGPGLNVTVTDAVPANTTFVSAAVTTGSGWAISAPAVGGTGNVVFSKASSSNGDTAVFTIVVKVNLGTPGGTTITNSVTVASTITDPTPGNNTAMATTTVDPTPPTITCPANVVATATSPGSTTVIVNYPPPTVMDNCPGATAACVPPSGSSFPLGSTTVTCTATDTSGNTAMCSFTVTTFDVCIQDDSNPATVLLWNSTTGDYVFCCGGVVYTGKGTILNMGNVYTLTDNTGTKRVKGTADKGTNRGTGYIQSPPGVQKCSITDRDIRNNTCACSAP